MVPTFSYEISRVSHYSGYYHVNLSFIYWTFTIYGMPSQTFLLDLLNQLYSPLPQVYYYSWFRLLLFRSPLLKESSFLSFPAGTKMFQFPASAHLAMCTSFRCTGWPIRTPADRVLFADPRGFSQLNASFIADGSQGILRMLLSNFLYVYLGESFLIRSGYFSETAVPYRTSLKKKTLYLISDYLFL